MFRIQLKRLREEKGLSQSQLAKDFNISQGTIGNWESGIREPNFAMLVRLADYFNVSVDSLLGHNAKESNGLLYSNQSKTPKTSLHAIGYVDFLGSRHTMKSEDANQMLKDFKDIYEAALCILHYQDIKYVENIKVKIFSDNIVVAIETDETKQYEDAFKISLFLLYLQFIALKDFKLFLRGGICIGNLYIDDVFVYGTGLIDAYDTESQRAKNPRIILEPQIANYIKSNKLKFPNMVAVDNDNLFFLNYAVCSDKNTIFSDENYTVECIDIINESIESVKNNTANGILSKLQWVLAYFTEYATGHNIEYKSKTMDDSTFDVGQDISKTIKNITNTNKKTSSK